MKILNEWKRTIDISYQRRCKTSSMGRFGGGWDWNFGFQIGGSTVILNLLVCMIRIEVKK